MNKNEIKISMPYEEVCYGTAYFVCTKKDGQSDEEFIAAVQNGDIIAYDVSVDEEWLHNDSEHIDMNHLEVEIDFDPDSPFQPTPQKDTP
jgi:hypothetical protein